MKKKDLTKTVGLAALILMAAFGLTLTGCDGDDYADEEYAYEEGTDASKKTDSDGDVNIDEALQAVADYNGCSVDKLNYCLDAYGFVSFLGASYTDQSITNADEAFDSIDAIIDLAGLDGCSFAYYREDVSPVSGFTYYTFTQTSTDDNEEMPVSYTNSQIRIIADADGNSRGFSADITSPDSVTAIDYDNFVDQDAAEQAVLDQMETGAKLFSDMTELTYWDDQGTSASEDGGKVAPVWLIYTNETRENKPYTMYVVSAMYGTSDEDEEQASVILSDKIACSTLNVVSDTYTSEFFFDGMEDGGTYTYTLDMAWALKADTGYVASETMDVTVPVMYDPQAKLYYLADYNERIAASNYFDFNSNNEVNAVVSENPSDLNSWHFASMAGPDGEQYFCDPNYVLASFDTMEKAYLIYKDRYGYNSVDTSGMPILLLMYECDEIYPESEADMIVNANNMGQWHDWAVFGTSPSYTGCVEVGTMTHEFAHGINGQLTNAQYLNEMGAVMEGYADSIGEQLAHMYGYKSEEYADYVGSEYASPLRCFSNPYEFKNPKYINGAYYTQPVDYSFPSTFDEGGVHGNSSVVNHLCYNLSHGDENDAVLTEGQNVDLFLETLYCATYNSGFRELGSYLLFAAENSGITQEQLQYVYDTLNLLGFLGDSTKLEQLIEAEGCNRYLITVQDDEQLFEQISLGALLYVGESEDALIMGQANDAGQMWMILPDSDEAYAEISAIVPDNGVEVGTFLLYGIIPNVEYIVPISSANVTLGDSMQFDKEIVGCSLYDSETDELSGYDTDTYEISFEYDGIYCVSLLDDNGSPSFMLLITE